MEKEKVIEFKVTKLNERYSSVEIIKFDRDLFENTDIFEDFNNIDLKMDTNSSNCFYYSTLYLNLLEINKPFIISNKDLEDLLEDEKNLNEKYGKPKRWRAKKGEVYYSLSSLMEITEHTEEEYNIDNTLYELGNYFKTEEAEKYRDIISKIFKADEEKLEKIIEILEED